MSFNVAVISYHKNADKIYPAKWIDEYRNSIENQTFKDFDLFEIEYGGGDYRIFEKSLYESKAFPTFVHTLNYLLDELFEAGYDCVLNTNCDDKYSNLWIEKTLPYIKNGYDLVTCNFYLMNDNGVYHTHNFEKLNIENELNKNNNIICHPGCCFNKTFWQRGNRYVPEEIPTEDLKMWQRGIKNSKFIVIPDHLVYHRVHDNSVCQSQNR